MKARHPEVSGLARSVADLNQDRPARIEADLRDKARREEPAQISHALARGEARGLARGARENALANARSFLQMGLDPAMVAKGAGLSLEEVEALSRDLR